MFSYEIVVFEILNKNFFCIFGYLCLGDIFDVSLNIIY